MSYFAMRIRSLYRAVVPILNCSPQTLALGGLDKLLPSLRSLHIEVTRFPSTFRIDFPRTIEQLHLQDDDGCSLGKPQGVLPLPKLKELRINYPATRYFEVIQTDTLESVVFFRCSNILSTLPDLSDNAILTLSRLHHLSFCKWLSSSDGDKNAGPVAALKSLLEYAPKLKTLGFTECIVDGEPLLEIMRARREGEKGWLSALEVVTLCRTKGITQVHCEELKKLVGKVNVYR